MAHDIKSNSTDRMIGVELELRLLRLLISDKLLSIRCTLKRQRERVRVSERLLGRSAVTTIVATLPIRG